MMHCWSWREIILQRASNENLRQNRVETPTITGKRLGILGLGKIGSRIAQRAARGFDMEIGYHNRAAVAGSSYRYFASLLELATWADFLVAAAPGGAGTRHLINAGMSPKAGQCGVGPVL